MPFNPNYMPIGLANKQHDYFKKINHTRQPKWVRNYSEFFASGAGNEGSSPMISGSLLNEQDGIYIGFMSNRMGDILPSTEINGFQLVRLACYSNNVHVRIDANAFIDPLIRRLELNIYGQTYIVNRTNSPHPNEANFFSAYYAGSDDVWIANVNTTQPFTISLPATQPVFSQHDMTVQIEGEGYIAGYSDVGGYGAIHPNTLDGDPILGFSVFDNDHMYLVIGNGGTDITFEGRITVTFLGYEYDLIWNNDEQAYEAIVPGQWDAFTAAVNHQNTVVFEYIKIDAAGSSLPTPDTGSLRPIFGPFLKSDGGYFWIRRTGYVGFNTDEDPEPDVFESPEQVAGQPALSEESKQQINAKLWELTGSGLPGYPPPPLDVVL